mgnify:CR=1 FL=1
MRLLRLDPQRVCVLSAYASYQARIPQLVRLAVAAPLVQRPSVLSGRAAKLSPLSGLLCSVPCCSPENIAPLTELTLDYGEEYMAVLQRRYGGCKCGAADCISKPAGGGGCKG